MSEYNQLVFCRIVRSNTSVKIMSFSPAGMDNSEHNHIFHCYFSFIFFLTVCRLLVLHCVYRSFRLVRFIYLRCCFQFVLSLSLATLAL